MSSKKNIKSINNTQSPIKTSTNKWNKRKIKNKYKRIHPIIKEIPQSKDTQMQIPITRTNMTRIKGKKDNNNYNNKIDGYGEPSTPSELKIDNIIYYSSDDSYDND
eukprot:493639_1